MSIPSFLRHARTRNRRTHQNNSQALTWQFDCPPNEQLSQSDLAHAKLALAFLHLARAFSSVLTNVHHYDTAVARLITPVVLSCTRELNELSASLFKALASSADEEPAKTVPAALLTDAGQQWLGEALNKQTPTHRKLFAAAERLLAATIERHQPALPHNLVLLQSVMQLSDAEMGFVELGLAIEHASLDFDMFGFISKTQLAAHMAERCNKELIYRTAADINDMYYGQSERNVAKLFDNCDIHSQIIFLDEADTLLMTRSESSHRADRAVTSEFLRRLEAFQGIFMCATNHGDLLDPALMRRFVFRLDVAPLNPTQRTQLLQELLGGTTDIPVLINDCTQQRLNRLDRLTPGDFANCKKRLTCLAENPTAEQWVEELEQEHNVKPLLRGRVGFV